MGMRGGRLGWVFRNWGSALGNWDLVFWSCSVSSHLSLEFEGWLMVVMETYR